MIREHALSYNRVEWRFDAFVDGLRLDAVENLPEQFVVTFHRLRVLSCGLELDL